MDLNNFKQSVEVTIKKNLGQQEKMGLVWKQ